LALSAAKRNGQPFLHAGRMGNRHEWATYWCAGLHRGVLMCRFPGALLCTAAAVATDFNDRGNSVIADQFNNRVIEVTVANTSPTESGSNTAPLPTRAVRLANVGLRPGRIPGPVRAPEPYRALDHGTA